MGFTDDIALIAPQTPVGMQRAEREGQHQLQIDN